MPDHQFLNQRPSNFTEAQWLDLLSFLAFTDEQRATLLALLAFEAAEVLVTTKLVTAAESGKTFYLSDVDGFTVTLPAPALGLKFRFVVDLAPTEASYVIDTGAANIMYGMIETSPVDDAARAVTGQQKINFVVDVALRGDWIELHSDGTNYYVSGMANVIEAVTVATS